MNKSFQPISPFDVAKATSKAQLPMNKDFQPISPFDPTVKRYRSRQRHSGPRGEPSDVESTTPARRPSGRRARLEPSPTECTAMGGAPEEQEALALPQAYLLPPVYRPTPNRPIQPLAVAFADGESGSNPDSSAAKAPAARRNGRAGKPASHRSSGEPPRGGQGGKAPSKCSSVFSEVAT